ncbi:MAG: hypothetical protein GY749_00600, partial [Desulfobacteraceae bacterium]|nr:hypothetical protein [Desulfobacteraceae bacterium]
GRIHKLGDSLKIPLVLVPMLRVGMQGVALRADIPKAKFVRQISVPQLMDAPLPQLQASVAGFACAVGFPT